MREVTTTRGGCFPLECVPGRLRRFSCSFHSQGLNLFHQLTKNPRDHRGVIFLSFVFRGTHRPSLPTGTIASSLCAARTYTFATVISKTFSTFGKTRRECCHAIFSRFLPPRQTLMAGMHDKGLTDRYIWSRFCYTATGHSHAVASDSSRCFQADGKSWHSFRSTNCWKRSFAKK